MSEHHWIVPLFVLSNRWVVPNSISIGSVMCAKKLNRATFFLLQRMHATSRNVDFESNFFSIFLLD